VALAGIEGINIGTLLPMWKIQNLFPDLVDEPTISCSFQLIHHPAEGRVVTQGTWDRLERNFSITYL
jgi:predicted membrane GTPase involved in stress response